MTDEFYARAVDQISSASLEELRKWAILYRAEELREEHRKEAAAIETAAHQQAIRDMKNRRAEEALVEMDLDKTEPWKIRHAYYDQVEKIMEKLTRNPSTDYSSEKAAQYRIQPGLWNELTHEEKILIVRAFPQHPNIDTGSVEWSEYLKTPAGPRGQRMRESMIRARESIQVRREALVAKVRQDAFMKWTSELLRTEFALGDGTVVSWGEATIKQHNTRVDMLYANASGNIEVAARHQAAIITLAERGIESLSQLASTAA